MIKRIKQSGFEDFRRRVPSISKISIRYRLGDRQHPWMITIDQIIAYYQSGDAQD